MRPDKAGGLNCPWSIKEKNLLTAQINSIFLPDQRIALEQLLTDAKIKFILCVSPRKVVDGAG